MAPDVRAVGRHVDGDVADDLYSRIAHPIPHPRPLVEEQDRAYILSQLISVDAVVLFDEETPLNLINEVKPDVLIKGGDYTVDEVVGRDVVESNGGKVIIIPLIPDRSTTNIIDKVRSTK